MTICPPVLLQRQWTLHWRLLLGVALTVATAAHAQDAASKVPEANPSRPTVTNPATLPPTGYLQFEQGYLGALDSPETETQYGVVQTVKLAVASRAMVQFASQPFARSTTPNGSGETITHDAGDLLAGGEVVAYTPRESEADAVAEAKDRHRHTYVRAATPTVTLGYWGRIHAGTAPDLDVGSFSQSAVLLASGHAPFVDVHYDTNFIVNEQIGSATSAVGLSHTVRRAQFGETFSVDRPFFNPKVQFSGEVYHFSQPLVSATSSGKRIVRANLAGALFAVSYEIKPNLVLDTGFSHGLTSTSTQWQSFAGFTYLLPRRFWPAHEP